MQIIKDNMLALGLVAVTCILAIAVVLAADSTRGMDSTEVDSGTTLEASLTEFAIAGNLSAEPGQVSISVMNDGAITHNLTVLGESKTSDLKGGESEILDLGTLAAANYTVICDIPGHREAGMEARLVIAEGVATAGDGTITTRSTTPPSRLP